MAALAQPAVPTLVSVDEYLHSVYEPDMDLVDGVLEDRNVGEFDHAYLQRALLLEMVKGERLGKYLVIQETRMQVTPTRFRVPDTCIIQADELPKRIIRQPPLLCIEVLSPEDRFTRMRIRCNDYLKMGVLEVWVFDPQEKTATVFRGETVTEHRTGTLRVEGTSIELSLDELFRAADVS